MASTKTSTKKKTAVTEKSYEDQLRENAIKYSENEKIEYFNLAEVVSIIYEKDLWQMWGFKSFEEFGEKELKRAYRTMRNLSVVGDMQRRTKVSTNDMIKVDRSILSNIASYAEAENLTKEQIKKLIDEVEPLTFEEAKTLIRSKRITDGTISNIIKLQLKYNEEQYKALEPIIAEAQGTFNTGENISLAILNALMVWGANRIPEQEALIKNYIKEKELDKKIKSGKVKRKEPSHKGKKKK